MSIISFMHGIYVPICQDVVVVALCRELLSIRAVVFINLDTAISLINARVRLLRQSMADICS